MDAVTLIRSASEEWLVKILETGKKNLNIILYSEEINHEILLIKTDIVGTTNNETNLS